MKRKLMGAILMIAASAFVIWLAGSHKDNVKDNVENESVVVEEPQDNTIEIWYAYKGYEKYLEYAITEYTQMYNTDIEIELKYVGDPGYFNYINAKSLEGNGPDLFIMGSEYMEKAYLLGLLEDNYNTDIYNTDNYPQIALDAATYSDRLVGYPLGFDVCAIASNEKFTSGSISTFEELKEFADNFGKTDEEDEDEDKDGTSEATVEEKETVDISNISAIITWDVNKLLMNYGFVGNYINFTNEDGKKVDMNNSSVINAANEYLLLKDYFSLSGEDNYETVKEKFINEEIVFALVGTDIIKEYNEAIDYEVSVLPDLTSDIKCNSLSYTDILAVNPRSNNKDIATKLAEFLTYTYAENMHIYSNIISCRTKVEYGDEHINQFIAVYEQSIAMPNMMETEDYNIIMEESLKAIWNGADVTEMFNSLQKKYSERFK